MKFAHLADVHIGVWKEPKLRELSTEAFLKAVDFCIESKVDFVLISGDLFNTALPGIDSLKIVVRKLKQLKENHIRVYIIAGSHDFSPSGKTMIDVLEEAALVYNVFKGNAKENKLFLKFTVDVKTQTKITGMLGKKGMLERNYYETLDKTNLESEQGFKIFMFHGPITEMKPEGLELMDSYPLSVLPKGFDYYAGGHVHIVKEYSEEDYKQVVYPGPLFPANFQEMEALGCGGFYLYENGKLNYKKIELKQTINIKINAENKNAEAVFEIINEKLEKENVEDKIVLLRISGKLSHGKSSDIDFKSVFDDLYKRKAFFVMKNTNKLTSEEFEEMKINQTTPEEIEDELIKEHLGQIKVSRFDKELEKETTKKLIDVLNSEKHEGEKQYEFEERVKKEVDELLEV